MQTGAFFRTDGLNFAMLGYFKAKITDYLRTYYFVVGMLESILSLSG